jgi:hypothetical protein
MMGMILSVLIILYYNNGGYDIQQTWEQFAGPTAIEDCNNAASRLNQTSGAGAIVVHAACYPI